MTLAKLEVLPRQHKIVFATPRKLPNPSTLGQAIVVLDIAFASNAGGSSFEKITGKFIHALGQRLRRWVDHHDSEHHQQFQSDSRFILHTKAEHGACPQIITPEMVLNTGAVDTIVCHIDFDGLASAAKWLRNGVEAYPGCDADAFAIDTRTGTTSALGQAIDRSLKANPSEAWMHTIVSFLQHGASDSEIREEINQHATAALQLEQQSERIAERFELICPNTVFLCVRDADPAFDRTHLLLSGQKLAMISAVQIADSVTFAAPFDSGINFLTIFGLSGGMPTVVSIQASRMEAAIRAITQFFTSRAAF
jgi:hypothetical protein